MSDETERLKVQTEETIKLMRALGIIVDTTSKKFEKLSPEELQKALKGMRTDLVKSRKDYKETFKDMETWRQGLRRAKENLDALTEENKRGRISDHQLRRAQEQYAKNIEAFNRAGALDAFSKSVTSASQMVTSGLYNTTKGVMQGIQSGSDAFEIGGNIISAGAGVAAGVIGSGASNLGKTMGTAGSTILTASIMTGNALGVLGGAVLAIAGGAITAFGEKLSDATKFGVEFVKVELQRVIKAYSEASRSGLMFADGLTGLQRAAVEAELPVDVFAAAASRNAAALASTGLGINEAVDLMGRALKAGGKSFRTEMLNLGYSLEEIPDLISETMSAMAGVGGPMSASNEEVLAQTREYAKHLRVLSAITGEDVKSRQEAARRMTNTLLVQQEMAAMSYDARIEFKKATDTLKVHELEAFKQLMGGTGVMADKSLNILTTASDSFRRQMEEIYDLYRRGALNEKNVQDIKSKYSAGILRELRDQKALAQVAALGLAGDLTPVTDMMAAAMEEAQKFSEESVKAGRTAAEKQSKTTDDLSESARNAQVAVQKMATAIQQKILDTKVMNNFANAVADVTNFISNALQKFADTKTFGSKPKRDVTKEKEAAAKAQVEVEKAKEARVNAEKTFGRDSEEAKKARIHESKMRLADAQAAFALERASRFADREIPPPNKSPIPVFKPSEGVLPYDEDIPSRKNGGLVDMPKTGGLALLHGKEAVVPLPDGNTIPVSLSLEPTEMFNASIESGIQNIVANIPKQEVETVTQTVTVKQPEPGTLSDRLVTELIKKIDDLTSVSRAANMTTARVVDKLDESNRIQRDILTVSR